jgi:hypothetical protein
MAHFDFVTVWRLRAPLEQVWANIYDHERWPSWWKGVERVDVVRRGGPDTVGTVLNHVWKSALPYRLRFRITITKVDPLHVIEVAAEGELRGVGRMSFSTDADDVVVRFEWNVDTTSTWMNVIAPAAAPLFRWNHSAIMRWGAECLARRINAESVKFLEG